MECEQIRSEHPDKEIPPCCESCHEDEEMGHSQDLWVEIDNKDRHVCCVIIRAFSNETK